MKKFLAVLTAIVAVAMMPSCVTTKAISRSKAASDQWLASQHKASPKINISGNYTSEVYKWGGASIVQKGSKVTGNIGNYSLRGIVSGYRVYLVASRGAMDYYAIILNTDAEDDLVGGFSDSIPFSLLNAEQISLNRINL